MNIIVLEVIFMENKLYTYLKENYEPGEPIFYEDVKFGSSVDSMRHQFKNFVKKGKLAKFDDGIFFIPKISLLGGNPFISTEKVIVFKYINRKNNVFGYFSGLTFANQIGISYQVPIVKEIVTNESSAIVRKVQLNNRTVEIRKPKVKITNENYKILQLLSLLENFSKYIDCEVDDAKAIIKKYAKENKITKENLFEYSVNFNNRVFKTILSLGI